MVAMMCGIDVLNRAIYMALVYHNYFSCSPSDWLQFISGFFFTSCGIAGLIFTPGKIMNEYNENKNN